MIKDEMITVIAGNSITKAYYRSLGYEVPNDRKEPIQVKSIDVAKSSKVYITRICGDEHLMKRVKYTPICRKCNSGSMSKDRADESLTTCPDCGCKISYKGKRCKYCSGKANSGENNPMYGKKLAEDHPLMLRNKAITNDPTLHHNYKDGAFIDAREGNKFQLWAKSIKELYNNRCDCCGYDREIALKAHHLYAYEKNANKGLDLDNGVALCANCHEEFHKEYGYGDNTPEQYNTFKGGYNG